jgi:hypothetical protein
MEYRAVKVCTALLLGLILASRVFLPGSAFAEPEKHSHESSGMPSLEHKLDKEIANREAGDKALGKNLAEAKKATATTANGLSGEIGARQTGDAGLKLQLEQESATREAADAASSQAIDAETAARKAADVQLKEKADLESSASAAGIDSLARAIVQEAAAREAEDAALRARVDGLPQGGAPTETSCMSDDDEGFLTGNYYLELNGHLVAKLAGVKGGALSAGIITQETTGPNGEPVLRKSLGLPRYCDLSLQIQPFGLDDAVKAWLQAFFSSSGPAVSNGAVVLFSVDHRFLQRQTFSVGFISEIRLKLNPTANTLGYIEVKVHASQMDLVLTGSASVPVLDAVPPWISSNFRVSLGSLPTNGVAQMDELVFRRKSPISPLDAGDLAFTVTGDGRAYLDWYKRSVLLGGNPSRNEMPGRVDLLTSSLSESPVSVTLSDLGITGLQSFNKDSDSRLPTTSTTWKVHCYVQSAGLDFNP